MRLLCITHQDGHVILSAAPGQENHLRTVYAMFAALGMTGYSTGHRTLAQAVIGRAQAEHCTICRPRLRCGCTPAQAGNGDCPHDGAAELRRAVEAACGVWN